MSGADPAPQRPLRIFVVAGEESGDRLGAALIRALRERTAPGTTFLGVGGRDMAAEGLSSLFPIDDLAIIGFAAIPRRLPDILRRIRATADAVVAARPDVLVIIDSPEFTQRVAKRVRARAPAIPIVDYVSPSVWAWRPWRARAMRRTIDLVLALLPFEPDAHRRLGGPPCIFVGHPLAEQVGKLRPNSQETQRRSAQPPLLLVLPGSRGGEIAHLAGVFGETLALLRAQIGAFEIVVPTVPHLASRVAAATASWPGPVRIVVDGEEKQAAMRTARAALAKSGTVTLELALAGIPMVAAYRVSFPEYLVGKALIHAPSAILANLVLGENAVPEFLQYDCTPERLAGALAPLLADGPERSRQLEAFARLDKIMEIGSAAPAGRAADAVLSMVGPEQPAFAETAPNRLGSPRQ